MRVTAKRRKMAEDVKISEEVPSKRRRLDPDSTSDDCGISNTSTYDSPTLVHGPLSYRNEDLANSSGLVNSNCDGVDECSRASIAEGSTTEDNLDQNHSANVVDVGGAEGGDNMSDVTDVSDISGHSEDIWQTMSPGSMMWVQDQIMTGISPRIILNDLIPSDVLIPDDIDDFTLCKIIVSVMSEPPRRKKLVIFNTLDDVLHLLRTCSNIMVLTGAGVSVSCGIPDFRSRNGIYARLAVDFPDLPDPHSMFDIKYFRDDPRPFFKFAKEIYPGQFEPSKSHKFIKLLEDRNKLLRNYTQNIDTLEQVAGIRNVIQCHGSFANATCMICKQKMTADDIKEDIFKQVIPRCPKCPPDDAMAVMKPDIVFFGESLPEEFHQQMATDKDKCDLLVVIGSSLKVRPVALIPNSIPPDVPQILINREPLKNMDFDVELLGDCDTIVTELCKRLEWEGLSCLSEQLMEEVTKGQLKTPPPYTTHDNVFPVVADSCEGRAGSEQQSVMAHQQVGAQVCNSSQNQSNGDKVTPSGQSSEFGVGTTASNGHIRSDNASIQTLQENICSSVCIAEETSVVSCPSVRHSVSSVTEKNMVEPDTSEVVGTEQNCIASSPTSQSAVISHVITESIVSNDEPVSSVRAINNGPREADEENGTNAVGVGLPGSSCATDDNSELEMILRMWQPKRRDSLSKRLEENQYLYLAPSRYVFPGAEVYDSCCSDDDEDDRKSLSSSPSSFSSHDSRVIEVDTADHMDNGECDPFPSTGHVSKCDQGEDVSKCDQGEDVSKCDQGEDVSKCDQGEDVSKCDQGEDVSKCDQGEDVSKCDQGEDVSKCDQGEDVSKCDQGEDVSKCDKPEDCCHVSKCDKPEDCCHVSKCNQGEDVSICDQGEDVSKCNQPEDVSKCDKPEDCCHVSKCDQPEECQSDTQVSTSLPLCEENLLC